MDGVPKDQQGPPSADAAKAEIWLSGHLGHLTEAEEAAFTAFKKLSAEKGVYQPATVDTKASHDDGTLVRYLRARKFVPQDAFVQFKDTEVWRKQNDLDALYEKIDIHDYQESRSVYPQWTGRRDKRGIPVYLYEVGKLDNKKMKAYMSSTSKSQVKGPSPSRMLRLFALYENLTRFVMPLCSAVPTRPNPETPVDQSNNIVDISKVGLKQFWDLRSHMQDASTLATAHYPETLDRIFILGAPAFFPTVWGWIKKWFDPITTSKIFILSHHQVLPTLSQFIDRENIPKKYGGLLDFECGDMPNLDPQVRDCLTIGPEDDAERFFLTAPVRWIDAGDDGEMTALGVGSIDRKQRSSTVATLHSLATRVATNSSNFQSQRTENLVMTGKPPTSENHNAPVTAAEARPISAKAKESTVVPTAGPNQEPATNISKTQEAPTAQASPPAQAAPPAAPPAQPPPTQSTPAHSNPTPPTHPPRTSAPPTTSLPPNTIPIPASTYTPSTDLKHLSLNEPPIPNGAPPENIAIPPPPPPLDLERTKTEFVTPPSDPSELKTLA